MLLIQVFDLLWLTSLLVLLFLIWRSSETRSTRAQALEATLVSTSTQNAESVRQMVIATQEIIAMLKETIAMLKEERSGVQ